MSKIGPAADATLGLADFITLWAGAAGPERCMRIIAGRLRRRTLLTNPGLTTRPITDRVKETLFERIEQSLKGARIADVFAGTGTMGFESLSRGAASVVFIEKDALAHELLKKNIAALGVADETLAWSADVRRCSFRPRGTAADFAPYSVIFFDPPYKMAEGLKKGDPLFAALGRLARVEVSVPNARLFFRVPEHCEFQMPAGWREEWVLTMSNMEIHAYRSEATAGSQFEVSPHSGDVNVDSGDG